VFCVFTLSKYCKSKRRCSTRQQQHQHIGANTLDSHRQSTEYAESANTPPHTVSSIEYFLNRKVFVSNFGKRGWKSDYPFESSETIARAGTSSFSSSSFVLLLTPLSAEEKCHSNSPRKYPQLSKDQVTSTPAFELFVN